MRKVSWPKYLVTVTALLLVTTGVAVAQEETGNIYVKVTDTSGSPLPGVTCEVSGFGAPQSRVTNASGESRYLALDPGDWYLQCLLEGFSTVEYPSINVRANRNVSIEVQLSQAIGEVITVTSESPLLDEKKIQAGSTISQVELEKIPTARDPWSVLAQTPGVMVDRINVGGNESGQQSVFTAAGTSDDENIFMVDGVEITDMSAIGSSATYYDFDQFTEMQFTTGGTDITKTTGGVSVNLVTKRGTNEFRGSARFLVTDADGPLFFEESGDNVSEGDLAPNQASFVGNGIRKIEEWGFEAGGPVIQDRLWFWGSHGQNDIKNLTGGATEADRLSDDTILTNTAFKINGQLSSANSLQASWNNGDKEKFGRNASPTRPQPTTWDQRGPTAVIKAEDTHVFNSNFFLTGRWSKVDGGFSLTSKAMKALGNDAPQAFLSDAGIWQNSFASGPSSRPQEEWAVDGSFFFGGNTSHELKFGARFRETEVDSAFAWSNDNAWGIGTPNNTTGSILITQRSDEPFVTQEYTSLWAQDTITMGNFTINAGLRYDLQDGANEAKTTGPNLWFPEEVPSITFGGADAPFDWSTISPRVGVTYALGEERKTLLRGSYSRFPEQLQTGDISRVNPAGIAYSTFLWYDTDGSGDFNGAVGSSRPGPDNVILIGTSNLDPNNPTAVVSPFRIDPGLDPELTDEILLGVEHAFMPEFVVGATVTIRNVSDIKEDRALIIDSQGQERTAVSSDFVKDGAPITGTIPTTGTPYSVQPYALNSAFSYTGGTLLVNGDRERDYAGIAVNFTKRLANQWMARGYVQWGEAEWDVPASSLANYIPSVCEDGLESTGGGKFGCNGANGGMIDGGVFAVQSAGSGAKADVWTQSTWNFNLNGMYQVAPDRGWGFNLAANIFGREGYPLPYFVEVTTSDGQSSRDLLAVEEVDDFRVDDIFTGDLRIDKEFAASGNVSFTVGADLFNALNDGYVLQRERGLSRGTSDFLRETLSRRVWRLTARLNWR